MALTQDNMAQVILAAPIGICVTSAAGLFELVNPAYCELYGYREEELLGRHFTLVVPEANRQTLSELHDRFIAGGADQEVTAEWEVQCKGGEARHILANAARIVDPGGAVRKVTYVVDITERKQMERRLDLLARCDELTGLLNRRAGLAHLEEEVARSQRYGVALSVAACDLDHFKQVNDRHGHAAGDRVLREAAARMVQALRQQDQVIRMGGEEFLVVLPCTALEDACLAMERLRLSLSALPIGELRQTLSVGVAELRQGETMAALLERADRALYRAKAQGRDLVIQAST